MFSYFNRIRRRSCIHKCNFSILVNDNITWNSQYPFRILKSRIYDFGGISGNFTPGSENYGVYEFKRGFGGNVLEYIGEFDLILDKFGYYIYDIGYKLYRNTKKVIAKILKR